MASKKSTKKAPKKAPVNKVEAQLLAEQKETDLANAKRHDEMVAEEEAKDKAQAEALENQALPIAEPAQLSKGKREEAWEKHLANYKKLNPVKYAQKEKAGQFKEIPASFSGTNEMVISK